MILMPMMHSENARNLTELVKNSGLDIKIRDAKSVESVEQEVMSLGYRLMNPYKQTIIIGI